MSNTPRNILVVGAGPAAWRFVRAYHEGAEAAGRAADTITVLNDEPYTPYDRVAIEQLLRSRKGPDPRRPRAVER